MAVRIEKTAWSGWPNCFRASNGEAELIVTSDIGPRVMSYGFAGGRNFFRVFESQAGKSGEEKWQLRGGHRLWIGPEHRERSYGPDNVPGKVEIRGETLVTTQRVEPSTGIRKQMEIRLADSGTEVEVLHRLQNTLPFAVSIAAWSVSMMAEAGTAVTGFPPRGRHEDALEPTNPLIMWAFTDLRDPRWKLLEKYLVLRHDASASTPTKLGHFNVNTWGAYFLGPDLFLKRSRAQAGRAYPDLGCSCELFTNPDMLEIETLGPIETIDTGESLEHRETWQLFRDVKVAGFTDEELDRVLGSLTALPS